MNIEFSISFTCFGSSLLVFEKKKKNFDQTYSTIMKYLHHIALYSKIIIYIHAYLYSCHIYVLYIHATSLSFSS